MRSFWTKCRCYRYGAEVLVVYGYDGGEDSDGEESDPWPSYSIWIVPGTIQ